MLKSCHISLKSCFCCNHVYSGEVTSTNSTNSNNSTSLADAFAILIEKARHAASQKEETELEEPLNMNNSSLILDLEERLPVPRTSSVETQVNFDITSSVM